MARDMPLDDSFSIQQGWKYGAMAAAFAVPTASLILWARDTLALLRWVALSRFRETCRDLTFWQATNKPMECDLLMNSTLTAPPPVHGSVWLGTMTASCLGLALCGALWTNPAVKLWLARIVEDAQSAATDARFSSPGIKEALRRELMEESLEILDLQHRSMSRAASRSTVGSDSAPASSDHHGNGAECSAGFSSGEETLNPDPDLELGGKFEGSDLLTRMVVGEHRAGGAKFHAGSQIDDEVYRDTILYDAAKQEGLSISQMLVRSVLHVAARDGNHTVVERAIDAYRGSRDGLWPSELIAAQNGHAEVVRVFLDKVRHDLTMRRTLLYESAEHGQEEVVKFLFLKGMDIDAKGAWGYNPLRAASGSNKPDLVLLLLDIGAHVNGGSSNYHNSPESTPLYAAASEGHFEIARILLGHGADVNAGAASGCSVALRIALENGHEKLSNLLLDHGAQFYDVNASPEEGGVKMDEALRLAIRGNSRRLARALIAKGANVNQPDGLFGTLLHRAAAHKSGHHIVRFLVKHGAKVGAEGSVVQLGGNSPLMAAVSAGNVETVSFLISQGASLDKACGALGNVLQTASHMGYRKMVGILLKQGVDANGTSPERPYETPLLIAVRGRHKEVVRLLISQGAKLRVKPKDKGEPKLRGKGVSWKDA